MQWRETGFPQEQGFLEQVPLSERQASRMGVGTREALHFGSQDLTRELRTKGERRHHRMVVGAEWRSG